MKYIKTYELKKLDLSKEISYEERKEYTKEIESLYQNAMEYFISIFPVSYEEGFNEIEINFIRDRYKNIFPSSDSHEIVVHIENCEDDIRRKIINFFNNNRLRYNPFIDHNETTFTFSLSIKQAEEYQNANKYNL